MAKLHLRFFVHVVFIVNASLIGSDQRPGTSTTTLTNTVERAWSDDQIQSNFLPARGSILSTWETFKLLWSNNFRRRLTALCS